MSPFSQVSQVFDNVDASRINQYRFENKAVAQLMHCSSKMFQSLDRQDLIQADISRQLWVIRSSILFTLLDFHDPALELDEKIRRLKMELERLPDLQQFIAPIEDAVGLLSKGNNPKREWLLGVINHYSCGNNGDLGILCALSTGRPPGWPHKALSEFGSINRNVTLISSRKDLKAGIFEKIIVPCSARNTPTLLLGEVLHSGRSGCIDVLLYSQEYFHVPKRFPLPESSIFKGKLKKEAWERESHEVRDDANDGTMEDWANDAFWRDMHNGERSSRANYVQAHYVLFQDGTGTFLPIANRVPVLSGTGNITNESDLHLARVDTLSDMDLVVLRAGDSQFLLDEASGRIMNDTGEENLLDKATDWKGALDTLLVTHSCDEIAEELVNRGVKTTATSIHQWAGAEVLGPGNEKAFKELIRLLHEKGKLFQIEEDFVSYANNRWASLQALRGVRQKAGSLIRQRLVEKMLSRSSSDQSPLGNRTSIRLEDDGGVELLILRVHSIDPTPAFVLPSRLCRIDDLRSNKWLG